MPSISVTNPELIVSMNLGDASPKLGGVVNLKNFKVIRTFYGDQQDLSGFQDYDHITTFTLVHVHRNKLTGNVPDVSASSSCRIVLANENNLDGTLPTTLPSAIQVFRAGFNNLLKSDSHLIPDLSSYTDLAEFNIQRQSADYGANIGSGWGGPGTLANPAITTAAGIEGAIPESMRIFHYGGGNLSPYSKRVLLTQFYDTFKDKPTDWAIDTAVNNVEYSSPKVVVWNSRGSNFTNLIGKHVSVSKTVALNRLSDVGFTMNGF